MLTRPMVLNCIGPSFLRRTFAPDGSPQVAQELLQFALHPLGIRNAFDQSSRRFCSHQHSQSTQLALDIHEQHFQRHVGYVLLGTLGDISWPWRSGRAGSWANRTLPWYRTRK